MNNIGLLCSLSALLIAAGCGDGAGPSPVSENRSFERSRITFTADTDVAVIGRLTRITTRCLPLVDGKGSIEIDWVDNGISGRFAVLTPVVDTIPHDHNTMPWRMQIPVIYAAGIPQEVSWSIAFMAPSTYLVSATAHLDSIYIADSSRYYWYASDVVYRHSPEGRGYTNYASDTGSGFIFRPPQ